MSGDDKTPLGNCIEALKKYTNAFGRYDKALSEYNKTLSAIITTTHPRQRSESAPPAKEQ